MNPNPFEVDKSSWKPGPWRDEPDYESWIRKDLPCVIIRHPRMGYLCGYVGTYQSFDLPDEIENLPHGGISFIETNPDYWITPKKGKKSTLAALIFLNETIRWIGFDCGHLEDVIPNRYDQRVIPLPSPFLSVARFSNDTYKDFEYVRKEVNKLADAIAKFLSSKKVPQSPTQIQP